MTNLNCRMLGSAAAVALAALGAAPAASAHDGDGGRHHRHKRGSHHVHAPFTYVETGRRVVVDAPFAQVYVDRHGRHIRAPFVNLWLPR